MSIAAPSVPMPERTAVLWGMFFMCLAGTLFPVMNGLVQVLSDRYPSPQIVWARTASHLIVMLALFAPRFGLVTLIRTNAIGWQLARSVALLASTLCFFTGVKYLPLAKAASISFMAPFIVALLAWPLLREPMSPRRLAGVGAGFLGVLIVIRPGSDVFHWSALLILASATFYAIYQVFTRKVAGRDRPETSAVYSALVGTVVMSIWVPFVWTPIQSWTDAALLASLGLFGGLGHYCVARALTYAAASVVAPFQYWQLIGSVAVGWALMGSLPDHWTWLGAAVIVAAGIYIGWLETREKRVV